MSGTTKKLVILGAGGHGRVLLEALEVQGEHVEAFGDDDPELAGASVDGREVLPASQVLERWGPSEVLLVNGVGSAGRPDVRRRVHERFIERGFEFLTVVHPRSERLGGARVGDGSQVLARAVLGVACVVGANSIVNTGAILDHDCVIGDHCHIAPGVTMSGGCTVGDLCHIGVGATLIQGVRIGTGSVVGAGSTVVADIPPGVIAYGSPARPVRDA